MRDAVRARRVPEPEAARFAGSSSYPPGSYRLLLATDPGRRVTAGFVVAGLAGTVSLVASRREAATFRPGAGGEPALAVASGVRKHTLRAAGFGLLGLWHTTAGDEPGEFAYAECVTAGPAAPLNPDDCTPLALTDTHVTSLPGSDAVVKQPLFFAASYGGFTLTDSGLGTFETPRLPTGAYTNSYRVSRGRPRSGGRHLDALAGKSVTSPKDGRGSRICRYERRQPTASRSTGSSS